VVNKVLEFLLTFLSRNSQGVYTILSLDRAGSIDYPTGTIFYEEDL